MNCNSMTLFELIGRKTRSFHGDEKPGIIKVVKFKTAGIGRKGYSVQFSILSWLKRKMKVANIH